MSQELDAFRNFERAGWSREGKGDDYEQHFTVLTSAFAAHLLDRLAIGTGMRLLDIGSGTGTVAAMAAQRGARVVGADFSAEMVTAARRLHPRLEFVVGEVESAPFDPRSFDVVVANFLFQHLDRPERALQSIARLLRPGGRVGLTNWVFGKRSIPSPQTIFMAAVAEVGVQSRIDLPAGPDLDRFDDPMVLADLLTAAGYGDIHSEEVALPVKLTTEQVWDSMTKGAVRVAALVQGFSSEGRELVRAALERRMASESSRLSLIATVTIATVRSN